MPLYSYQCKDCDYKFEKLIKSEERDNKYLCPQCGNSNTKRVFSTFASFAKSSSTPSCSGG